MEGTDNSQSLLFGQDITGISAIAWARLNRGLVPVVGLAGVVGGHSRDCAAKCGQFMLDDRPHQIEVNLEVPMHQHVSHSDDLSPRHVWLLIACALGEPAGGLADDLQVSDYPDLDQLIRIERFSTVGGVSPDSVDGFDDVLNSVAI
jgi:hypothetical protein